MSHIARELKMLFYLNNNIHRNVKISELAELLEVTPRQVRRYRDDLDQCEFYVLEERGPNGGYKLQDPLDKSLMIPENIMLALNIAAKNNESLINSLKKLPVVPKINDNIILNNNIFDDTLDKASIICEAKYNNKSISFDYIDRYGRPMSISCNPYELTYANHTYYLIASYKPKNNNEILVKYDIDNMSNIKPASTFTPNPKLVEESNKYLQFYGIKGESDKETTLILEYANNSILRRIDRLFDYKGAIDEANKTYTVKSLSENELFYPLFSLGTKDIKILNKDFKIKYMNYLKNQLDALGK